MRLFWMIVVPLALALVAPVGARAQDEDEEDHTGHDDAGPASEHALELIVELELLAPCGTLRPVSGDACGSSARARTWVSEQFAAGVSETELQIAYRARYGEVVTPPEGYSIENWATRLAATDKADGRALRHIERRYRTTCGAPESLEFAETCGTGRNMKAHVLAWFSRGWDEGQIETGLVAEFTVARKGQSPLSPLMRPATSRWMFIVGIVVVLGVAVVGTVLLRGKEADAIEADEAEAAAAGDATGADADTAESGRAGDAREKSAATGEAAEVDSLIEKELRRMG